MVKQTFDSEEQIDSTKTETDQKKNEASLQVIEALETTIDSFPALKHLLITKKVTSEAIANLQRYIKMNTITLPIKQLHWSNQSFVKNFPFADFLVFVESTMHDVRFKQVQTDLMHFLSDWKELHWGVVNLYFQRKAINNTSNQSLQTYITKYPIWTNIKDDLAKTHGIWIHWKNSLTAEENKLLSKESEDFYSNLYASVEWKARTNEYQIEEKLWVEDVNHILRFIRKSSHDYKDQLANHMWVMWELFLRDWKLISNDQDWLPQKWSIFWKWKEPNWKHFEKRKFWALTILRLKDAWQQQRRNIEQKVNNINNSYSQWLNDVNTVSAGLVESK